MSVRTPPPGAGKGSSILDLLSPNISRQNIWSLGKSLSARAQTIFSPQQGEGEHALAFPSPPRDPGLADLVQSSIQYQSAINEEAARNQRIQKAAIIATAFRQQRNEVAMREGLRQLNTLKDTVAQQAGMIDGLNDSVTELQIEASVQRDALSRLRKHLQENTKILRDSIARYCEDKRATDALLASQQTAIEKLRGRRCKQDFIVDTVLFLACLAAVNISLVDIPLRLALRLLPRKRLRTFVRQLLKLFLLVMLFLRGRGVAKFVGLHQNCGSLSEYLVRVYASARRATARLGASFLPIAAPEPRTPARSGSPPAPGIVTPSQWSED